MKCLAARKPFVPRWEKDPFTIWFCFMYIRPLYYMGLFYVLTIKGLFYVHETPIL